MMPLLSGERDLLEKPFLEWFRAELGGTEENCCSRVGPFFRANAELLSIIGPEVRVVPIAFKDRRYFVDDVWIASARYTNIPFEPANLSRVREVGRTYVGGGKPGLPV
jgi:hypothetical protein